MKVGFEAWNELSRIAVWRIVLISRDGSTWVQLGIHNYCGSYKISIPLRTDGSTLRIPEIRGEHFAVR